MKSEHESSVLNYTIRLERIDRTNCYQSSTRVVYTEGKTTILSDITGLPERNDSKKYLDE